MAGPSANEIIDGYRFKGGDPSDQNSWEKFDSPKAGDIQDGFTFRGGDPSAQDAWEPVKPERSFLSKVGEFAGDVGSGLLTAPSTFVETLAGAQSMVDKFSPTERLANAITPGREAAKIAATNEFLGKSQQAREFIQDKTLSDTAKAQIQEQGTISKDKDLGLMEGAAVSVGQAIMNPRNTMRQVLENLPSLFAGGAAMRAAKPLGAAAEGVAGYAATGALEGGGAYSQTLQEGVKQLAKIDDDQLAQTFPSYADDLRGDIPREQALMRLADRAATTAGGIAALFAPAVDKVLGGQKLDKSLFTRGAAESVPKALTRETTAETLQGAGGQFAQNVGAKSYIDPNQSLAEGVGAAAGAEGFAGLLTAGGMRAMTPSGKAFDPTPDTPATPPPADSGKSPDPIKSAIPVLNAQNIDTAIAEAFKSAGIRDLQDAAIVLDSETKNGDLTEQKAATTQVEALTTPAPVADTSPTATPAMAQKVENGDINATNGARSDIPNTGAREPNLGVSSADGQPDSIQTNRPDNGNATNAGGRAPVSSAAEVPAGINPNTAVSAPAKLDSATVGRDSSVAPAGQVDGQQNTRAEGAGSVRVEPRAQNQAGPGNTTSNVPVAAGDIGKTATQPKGNKSDGAPGPASQRQPLPASGTNQPANGKGEINEPVRYGDNAKRDIQITSENVARGLSGVQKVVGSRDAIGEGIVSPEPQQKPAISGSPDRRTTPRTQPAGEVNAKRLSADATGQRLEPDIRSGEGASNAGKNQSSGTGIQGQDRRTTPRSNYDAEVTTALNKARDLAKNARTPEEFEAADKAINEAEDMREAANVKHLTTLTEENKSATGLYKLKPEEQNQVTTYETAISNVISVRADHKDARAKLDKVQNETEKRQDATQVSEGATSDGARSPEGVRQNEPGSEGSRTEADAKEAGQSARGEVDERREAGNPPDDGATLRTDGRDAADTSRRDAAPTAAERSLEGGQQRSVAKPPASSSAPEVNQTPPTSGVSASDPSIGPKERMDALLRAAGVDTNLPADKSATLRKKAEKLQREAREMLDRIPPGQPVSSTRDVNLREKSAEKSRKAAELFQQADALQATSDVPSVQPAPPQTTASILREAADKIDALTRAPEQKKATEPDAKPTKEANLSRATKPTRSIDPADAKAAVAVITKRWKNAPPIIAHNDFTTAPDPLQGHIAEVAKGDEARGAWYNNEIHLFTQNIGSIEQLERTILHEARHYGLQGLFGKDMNPVLMEIYMKDAAVRKAANKVAKELELSSVDAVNEVLADMPLDAAKKLNGWTKLVAKLKQWLEANGFTNIANMLSGPNADAITKDILFQIEDFVKNGKRSDTTLTTTMFSRELTIGGVQSVANQPGKDALNADAKFLSDFLEGGALISHGKSDVRIPSSVVAHMFSATQNPQVLDAVIRSLPVDVMNFLASKQLAPQDLFHDKAMLEDILSVDTKSSVPLGINVSAKHALIGAVARESAKVADLAGRSGESDSAGFTGASDLVSGRHSRQSITQSKNFLNWFGNSKVVDADGNPLVVYHGTDQGDIVQFFEGGHFGDQGQSNDRLGATNKLNSGVTYPVYLKIENPFYSQDVGDDMAWNRLMNRALSNGHDGIIYRNDNEGAGRNSYLVWNAEQIKSAIGNKGTFDATNPDIRFSRPTSTAAGNAPQATKDAANAYTAKKLAGMVIGGEIVTEIVKNPSKFNAINRTLNTQLHKALKNKEFGKVFWASQQFMEDVSQFATQAADFVPDILPNLGNTKHAVKLLKELKNPAKLFQKKHDLKAAGRMIFEGTMAGGGNPMEGRLYSSADLKAKGLSERAIDFYMDTRKAIDKSINDLVMSDVIRMIGTRIDLDPNRYDVFKVDSTGTRPVLIDAIDQSRRDAVKVASETKAAYEKAKKDREYAQDLNENFVKRQERYAKEGGIGRVENASKIEVENLTKLEAKAESLMKKEAKRLDTWTDIQNKTEAAFQQADDLQAAGYAPLMRFGKLWVTATKGEETLHRAHYENRLDLNAAKAEMRKAFPDAEIKTGIISDLDWKKFQGVTPETIMLFAKTLGLNMDEHQAAQKYYQEAVSSRSALKRRIKREGIPGFSDDLSRVLAGFITSNSRRASSNYNMPLIQLAQEGINENDGDIRDEASKLVDQINNPTEDAAALRGVMYAWFIGGSVASAAVNFTQPITMTLPELSQWGAGKAALAMKNALRINLPDHLKAAKKMADEKGITNPQEVYYLYNEAIRGVSSNKNFQTAMWAWGAMFSFAENMNRRTTFLASYEMWENANATDRASMTKVTGADNAFDFAKRIIQRTQGVYNKANRPNWARGAVGATVFTFKQYSIAYLEFASRLPTKPKVMAAAILVLMAGLQGLPGAEDLEDLFDTLGQMMGYRTNSKDFLRQKAIELLGETAGAFLMTGLFNQSGRLGLGNLIPGTAMFKRSETERGDDLGEAVGPLGGLVKNVMQGFDEAQAGDYMGALASLLPKAMGDAAKGYQIWDTGAAKDFKNRDVVQDLDKTDAVFQGIGFNPGKKTDATRESSAKRQDANQVKDVQSDIVQLWAEGMAQGDDTKKERASDMLESWNDKNPEAFINRGDVIDSAIRRRIEMGKSREERQNKTLPKSLRAHYADR